MLLGIVIGAGAVFAFYNREKAKKVWDFVVEKVKAVLPKKK